MKKLLLAAVLITGAAGIAPSFAPEAMAQTCDPQSPCLYTGKATSSSSGTKEITVKMDANRQFVATVSGHGTFYVLESTTETDKSHGAYYVNIDGTKYYFNM